MAEIKSDWDNGIVWVVNCYLDEAGWDGKYDQIYVTSKEDAETLGRLMAQRIKRRVKDGDQRLDYDVYSVSPYEFETPDSLKRTAHQIADEWLNGLDL